MAPPKKQKEEPADSQLSVLDSIPELLEDIGDPHAIGIILQRAQGNSWKLCAAAVGISESKLYMLRNEYNIDQRARAVAQESAKRGLTKLMSHFSVAIDTITELAGDTTIKPEARLSAANSVVKALASMAGPIMAASGSKPRGVSDPVDRDELIAALRAARADTTRRSD